MMTELLPVLSNVPNHAWGYGPGWFPWIPFFWLLLVGFLVFALMRRRHHWHHDGPGSALGVLRERYARGEIDESEYRQRLEVLRARGK
ncbi:SHOCT domain-containing protein [Glutamicibacter sp. NPDC087344]|uniref:SHOCT domain-containing protein n=1 Tax=Glutamicibacter sp. NPDC087344 TaxID=3363994 RepID=UPI0038264AF7